MGTEVQNILQLLDRVFYKLGQKPLCENTEFIKDKEMSSDYFLRFFSKSKPGRIDMKFEIEKGGLTFWLDRASEIPEWSIDFIDNNPKEVESELLRLFKSPIQVVHQGNKTTVKILERGLKNNREFRFYIGFGLRWLHTKEINTFNPYFE